MKRRSFTFGLAAQFTAPVVPTLTVGAVPSSTAVNHFALAKMITRAHNHYSTDMLMRHLRVNKGIAHEVERLLIQRGVITTPINGVAMATSPLNTHCVPTEALKPTNFGQSVADFRDRFDKRLKEIQRHLSSKDEDVTPSDHALENTEQKQPAQDIET